MAMQFSVSVRNARLDAIETTIGPSARLIIFTSTQPTSCAADDSGILLATLLLPTNYMDAAANGRKSKSSGLWTATSSVTGTAGHFRFKNSAATVTHIQGSISAVGGAGQLWLDSISIVAGQPVTVSSCVWSEGGA